MTFTRSLMAVRAALVALVLLAACALPGARGASIAVVVMVAVAYLLTVCAIGAVGRRHRDSDRAWGTAVAFCDAAFVAWASYGSTGFDSPLRHLLLVQLIGLAFLGSVAQALRVALFQGGFILALFAVRAASAQGDAAPTHLLGDHASLGRVGVDLAVYVFVAGGTALVAWVGEQRNRRRRADLDLLGNLTARLESAGDPGHVAAELLDGLLRLHRTERAVAVRLAANGAMRVVAARGIPAEEAAEPLDSPVIAAAIEARRSVLTMAASQELDGVCALFPKGARLVIVPLGGGARRIGAVIFEHPPWAGNSIRRRTLSMVEHYAAHAAIVLRNVELLAEVRALAVTDALTGLPNRRHLDETLMRVCAQVSRGLGSVGVLMLDVDHFKELNDLHGHQVGDAVLRSVGHALERELRAGDMAARYGGEEFTVLMVGACGAELAQAAERLRVSIDKFTSPVRATVSIGVAWAPANGSDPESLIAAADAALYRAKAAGRNRVIVAPTPDANLIRFRGALPG